MSKFFTIDYNAINTYNVDDISTIRYAANGVCIESKSQRYKDEYLFKNKKTAKIVHRNTLEMILHLENNDVVKVENTIIKIHN